MSHASPIAGHDLRGLLRAEYEHHADRWHAESPQAWALDADLAYSLWGPVTEDAEGRVWWCGSRSCAVSLRGDMGEFHRMGQGAFREGRRGEAGMGVGGWAAWREALGPTSWE